MPENNEQQNRETLYAKKCAKHIACSHAYKLVCFNDKFSKPFKIWLGEDVVYNFINSMIEESKYCRDVMKKTFWQRLK